MILLELFLSFLQIGAFSFGGATPEEAEELLKKLNGIL